MAKKQTLSVFNITGSPSQCKGMKKSQKPYITIKKVFIAET